MADDENPLLEGVEARRLENSANTATVLQLFLSPELHKPLMITCFAMISQQISGMIAL
jgi:CCR4-NOT transcription complex subunit 1